MIGLLTRQIAWDASRLFAFYAVAFIALIAIALAAPLVRGGAPLGDVLVFLPNLLAMPATLCLPLAMITSVLATLGRMRDDGELIALQAAGISTLTAARASAPLALLTALMVGLLAHHVLPDATRNWRIGKAELLRQAVATKVARRRFIVEDDRNGAVAANAIEDGVLKGVFGRYQGNGELLVYAPQARWVAGGDGLSLELEQARLMRFDDNNRISASGLCEALTIDLNQGQARDNSEARLGRDSGDLHASHRLSISSALWQQALIDLADQDRDGDPGRLLDHTLAGPVEPLAAARWYDRHRGLAQAAANHQLQSWGGSDLDLIAIGHGALASGFYPDLLTAAVEHGGQQAAAVVGRLTLDRILHPHLAPAAHSRVLELLLERVTRANWHEETTNRVTRQLRDEQMNWHLRWLLPCATIAGWLLACGLALGGLGGNRMIAVGIAIGAVLITLLPGLAAVKGLRGRLLFNPAWIMWPPTTLMAVIGATLAWRRR
ncbi:MAG: LptF/LptG family permease [Planctomycetota bacterium]|jgi:lipopolysaccharide export LptBFGC system permease protein LptF